MSVIRLQEMTPQVYTEESRDFQLLSRLYDSVFNGLKFDTDSILDLIDTKECRTSVLQLLQTKLGFFTERKIDDEKLRSILECFPILVRNKGSLRAIKETLYLFLRMYSVSSNMEIYYLPTPYSPPFSEEEPCVLASGKLPENNSLVIRIHSFETKPDTSVMEEIFKYILPAGINYYIEFDKSATLQDIVLKSEDSAELTFVSDNINSQLRSSDQTEPYNIGTVNTSSLISTDSYVSNRFIGYYGDEQSASDYLATLVDKIYSTAVINYSATGEVSGPIVSISDAEAGAPVEALSVAIEPIQDLHGYDHPWPAGGGKNLFDPAKATISNGAYGFTITRDGNIYTVSGVSTYTGNPAFAITTNYATADLSGKGYVCQVFDWSGTHSVAGVWGFRTESEKAFALSLSSVTAGETVNVSFKISVSPTSQTAWTPYSNECPISGWSAVGIKQMGKNLLRYPYQEDRSTISDVNVTNNSDGSFVLNGTVSGTLFYNFGSGLLNNILFKSGTYTLSGGDAKLRITVVKNLGYFASTSTTTGSLTFTLTEDAYLYFYASAQSGTVFNNDSYYPMLVIGSSEAEFAPYNGNLYTISFGQTVYGGTLDVKSGKMKVEYFKFNGKGKTFARQERVSGTGGYMFVWSGTNIPATYLLASDLSTAKQTELYSSGKIDNPYSTKESCAWAFQASASSPAVIIRFGFPDNMGIETLEDFYAWVDEQDEFSFLYPLKEAFEISLTPEEITLLQGENNLWSDAGDISITYKRDSTYKAMICTAYSSNTPTWHRINFLGNLTTEEVSTQGGIVSALQAKGITVNNGDLIKYNNLYLLRVNNDWQECNYARYILNTYHLTE